MSSRANSDIAELLNRIQQTAMKLKEVDSIRHAPFIRNIKEIVNEYFLRYDL